MPYLHLSCHDLFLSFELWQVYNFIYVYNIKMTLSCARLPFAWRNQFDCKNSMNDCFIIENFLLRYNVAMQYRSRYNAQEQEARDSHNQYLQSRKCIYTFWAIVVKGVHWDMFAVRLLRFAIFKNSCTKIPLSSEQIFKHIINHHKKFKIPRYGIIL